MDIKIGEKTRFSTTSLRKMIFDIFLVWERKLENAKIHKNVEYYVSKFFLVKYGVEMSMFDQKRLKIRFFQNDGLSIVLDVKIVTEKL
jgi:hypothetical protein